MSPEELEYVKYRLARADEALDEAMLLFKGGHNPGTVSKLYYACFYAVTALLYTSGFVGHKHSGVISAFHQNWIKTGRLPKEMGDFFSAMFDRRLKGDYKDEIEFTTADVETWFEETRQFVGAIKSYLDEHYSL